MLRIPVYNSSERRVANGNGLQYGQRKSALAPIRHQQIHYSRSRQLHEQRAIAGALSDVDALLAKLDALIAKKRDLKQAAMQQLLTGQTRLPGFQRGVGGEASWGICG